jgi:hypothetical protein
LRKLHASEFVMPQFTVLCFICKKPPVSFAKLSDGPASNRTVLDAIFLSFVLNCRARNMPEHNSCRSGKVLYRRLELRL